MTFALGLTAMTTGLALTAATPVDAAESTKSLSAIAPGVGTLARPGDPLCAITSIVAQAGAAAVKQSEGTRRMVERLQRTIRQTPPDNVPYRSAERVELLRA